MEAAGLKMALSKKQRNYIRDYGKTESVRRIARKLGLNRAEVREAVEEMEAKGELKAKPPAPPVALFDEKTTLTKHDYRWAAIVAVVAFFFARAGMVWGLDARLSRRTASRLS